jgi:hypothetical protein
VPAPAAAGQAGGGVQEAVAQGLGFGFGEGAVEGEQPQLGEQGGGDQRGGQPGLVEREGLAGQVADAGGLPVRTQSSTRAWTRWAASM